MPISKASLLGVLENFAEYVSWSFSTDSWFCSNFVGCFLTGTAAEVTPVSAIAEYKFKVCELIIDLNESYLALVKKKKAA